MFLPSFNSSMCKVQGLGSLSPTYLNVTRGPWLLKYLLPRNVILIVATQEVLEGYNVFYQTYGPFMRKWILQQPIVTIAAAEDAEVILTCRTNINKSMFYKFVHKWLGTGLLTSSGSKWTTRRKLLTPAFHFSVLNTFTDVMIEKSNLLLDKLKIEENQSEFVIDPYINNCTLDIICETAMGVKINAQEGSSRYTDSIKEMGGIVTRRARTPWFWIDWIYSFSALYRREKKTLEILHGFTSQVISQRKMARKKVDSSLQNNIKDKRLYQKKNKAFLDLLLDISEESGDSFSDADVREEVDTFMFEGHDTVSAVVSWAIYLIGSHPDIQEKIFEELNSIFGSSERHPTIEDIRQMNYLEMVIKESLRLYPPGFMIFRTLTTDIILRGFKIPSGTIIEINIYQIHRDPKHYKNPENFDPEHFSSENCFRRHPFAFIPFSAGPRNCIGQKFSILEEKILLSTLLRRYKFEALQKPEDIIKLPELVLRPGNGIKVRISRRLN